MAYLLPSSFCWLKALFLALVWFLDWGSVDGESTVKVGTFSKVEDAVNFHIYYGQTFKVIKNTLDGHSYLLLQVDSIVSLLFLILSLLKMGDQGNGDGLENEK